MWAEFKYMNIYIFISIVELAFRIKVESQYRGVNCTERVYSCLWQRHLGKLGGHSILLNVLLSKISVINRGIHEPKVIC